MWELDHKESWVLKNWCFWTVMLEKTLESPLDCKEIQPVHPKGNQPWIFIGRTDGKAEVPLLWPPNTKSQFIGKNPDTGKSWKQGENRNNRGKDRWHHWLNGHKFEQAPGYGEGQGTLPGMLQSMGSQSPDTTEQLNNKGENAEWGLWEKSNSQYKLLLCENRLKIKKIQ